MFEFRARQALHIQYKIRGGWRGKAIGSGRSPIELIAKLGAFRRAIHECQDRARPVRGAK